MRLDPRQVAAAAEQLDRSLSIFRGVSEEGIPWLFDRRGTADAARSLLGDASDWASSAASELRGAPTGPLTDARASAERFAAWTGDLRDATTGKLRAGLARQDAALTDAQRATKLLRTVSEGLSIGDSASYRLNVQRLLGREQGQTPTGLAAATVLGDAHPEQLGELAPFVAAAGARDERYATFSSRVAAYDGNIGTVWNEYLYLAGNLEQPAGRVREAFDSTARTLHPDAPAAAPAWLTELPADSPITLSKPQALDLDLRARARTADDTARVVLDRILVPTRDVSADRVLRARLASDLPEPIRADLLSETTFARIDEASASGQYWLSDDLKAAVTADIDAYLADHPDQVRRQVERVTAEGRDWANVHLLGRLGSISPAAVVGDAAATQPWVRDLFDSVPTLVRNDYDALNMVGAWDLVRSTGGDRDALLQQLADVAATPVRDRTRDQLQLLRSTSLLPDEHLPAAYGDVRASLVQRLGEHGEPYAWNYPDEFPDRAVRMLGTIADAEATARRGGITRAAATQELDELLAATVDTAPTAEQLERFQWLDALPADVRPRMSHAGSRPFLSGELDRTAIDGARDVARLLRESERMAAEPGASSTRTLDELESLLARPDEEFTVGDLRRTLALAWAPDEVSAWRGVPPRVSLEHGLGSSAQLGRRGVDLTQPAPLSYNSRLELDRMRIAAQRSRIAQDPATTAESVRAMLRGIADTPKYEVTHDQVRLLAALDGLPDELRYDLPQMNGRRLADLHGQEPPAGTDVIWPLALLRRSLDATAAAEAAGHTRADLTAELRTLLIDSNDRMPEEAWSRIYDIASLRSDLRPDLPSLMGTESAAWGANNGGYRSGISNTWLSRMRQDAFASGVPSIDEIAAHARTADGSVDLARLDAAALARITSATDPELQRIGLDRMDLIANALDPSRGSGTYQTVATAVLGAQPLVAELVPRSPTEEQLVATLRTLLDDNRARVEGRLRGGYSTHPDYAQHGRAIATFDTLRAMRRIEARASEQAAATIGAAPGEIAW